MWIEREITRELKNTAETFPVLVPWFDYPLPHNGNVR